MYVDHGEFGGGVRRKELLPPAIKADEGVEEGDGGGRKVHYIVVECSGLAESPDGNTWLRSRSYF